MTAVQLFNLALLKIGQSKGITALGNESRAAWTGELIYDHTLRQVLRTFPWPFATRYADLAWVEGDGETAVNGDWLFSYRWPSDCLFARRIVPAGANGTGRQFSDTPVPFREGHDATGILIYCNENHAESAEDDPVVNLEYTAINCDGLWADDIFIDAFTWLLASKAAPSLSRDDKLAGRCFAMYQLTLEQAAAVATREGQQEKVGEAEWMRNR